MCVCVITYLEGEGVQSTGIDDGIQPHFLAAFISFSGLHPEQAQEVRTVFSNLQDAGCVDNGSLVGQQ